MWCPECKRTKRINLVMKQKPNGNYFCSNCKHTELAPQPRGYIFSYPTPPPLPTSYGGQTRSKSSNTSRILSHCRICSVEIWSHQARMYCTSCQKQRMQASNIYMPSSYGQSIPKSQRNPNKKCPNCGIFLGQILNPDGTWIYHCELIMGCFNIPRLTPASLKAEAERIFLKMTKELRYTKIYNATIIELYFITHYKRGWFKENIKPVVELMKSQIPSSMREYDSKTFKWQIDAGYWLPLQQMLEALNFTCTEEFPKVGVGTDPLKNVVVDKDYAENFHYKQESIGVEVEDKFALEAKLSEFGVSNKSEYRNACRRLHPDLGGDATKMSELNRLWTLYQKQLEVGVTV